MTVKLAIAVGQQAARAAQADPGLVSTIFCSSGADGEVLHEICSALAAPGREISPTRFHNSVQNAPAGYWGIATHSHAPSTSLACFDWSCAAGLIEAAAQLATDFEQVLLICFDSPYPEPLASVRRVAAAFAFSLLMSRAGSRDSLARIELRPARGESQSRMIDPALEALRLGNPAARGLPLLASLAGQSQSRVVLEYVAGGQLGIDVTPCG
jgi:hypothetical protein